MFFYTITRVQKTLGVFFVVFAKNWANLVSVCHSRFGVEKPSIMSQMGCGRKGNSIRPNSIQNGWRSNNGPKSQHSNYPNKNRSNLNRKFKSKGRIQLARKRRITAGIPKSRIRIGKICLKWAVIERLK